MLLVGYLMQSPRHNEAHFFHARCGPFDSAPSRKICFFFGVDISDVNILPQTPRMKFASEM